ncbi:unnamed protein product [Closterium sp. NIES-53]
MEASSLEFPSSTAGAPSLSPAPAPASSDPAGKGKGKVEDSGNVTHADATASGSGLSLEENLRSLRTAALDSDFLEDDSDEELEVDVRTEAFNHVLYTAILLLPVALTLEVALVITTVQTLMRRVWSSMLSDGAADSAKFQELLPTYVAKTRYSRLQVSLLHEEDIRSIRSKEVDYTRPNSAVVRLYWQHTDNPAFVRERATNSQVIGVVIRDVPATKTPEMLRELMAVYQLRNRKRSALKDGVCFHRVLHPVTGADTDVIKGLVIPHRGDHYRWRHVFQDPPEIGRRYLVHFPALSCLLCGGQHYDVNHDAFTTERRNNIGKWNLTLGRVHRINGNCFFTHDHSHCYDLTCADCQVVPCSCFSPGFAADHSYSTGSGDRAHLHWREPGGVDLHSSGLREGQGEELHDCSGSHHISQPPHSSGAARLCHACFSRKN